jgi:hypothetical protein
MTAAVQDVARFWQQSRISSTSHRRLATLGAGVTHADDDGAQRCSRAVADIATVITVDSLDARVQMAQC